MTDWLRVRPRAELPGIEDVTLPPLARRIRALRDGAMLSGTALIGLPRRGFGAASSIGGEIARSLIGDMLRVRGLSGEGLRGFRITCAGKGFHCVSFDCHGAVPVDGRLFAVIGVVSRLAMSNGLMGLSCVEIAGMPGTLGRWPCLTVGTLATSRCCRGPRGVCGATWNGCRATPP